MQGIPTRRQAAVGAMASPRESRVMADVRRGVGRRRHDVSPISRSRGRLGSPVGYREKW